jgi:hypothetical protein
MADIVKFPDQLTEVSRKVFAAIDGLAETQLNAARQLSTIQQELFSQISEAVKDELHLISRMPDPRDFASAQADLVKTYGQRYADCMKKSLDIVAEAWKEYGNHMETTIEATAEKAQQAPKKAA